MSDNSTTAADAIQQAMRALRGDASAEATAVFVNRGDWESWGQPFLIWGIRLEPRDDVRKNTAHVLSIDHEIRSKTCRWPAP